MIHIQIIDQTLMVQPTVKVRLEVIRVPCHRPNIKELIHQFLYPRIDHNQCMVVVPQEDQ